MATKSETSMYGMLHTDAIQRSPATEIQTRLGTLLLRGGSNDSIITTYKTYLRRDGELPERIGRATTELLNVQAIDRVISGALQEHGFGLRDKIGYIANFYPLDDAQDPASLKRKGVGSAALAQLEKNLERVGAVCVVLYSFEASEKFYERNGYEHIGHGHMTKIYMKRLQ